MWQAPTNRVFVKISKELKEQIFYSTITKNDGTQVKIFTEPELEHVLDASFSQNVHVGIVISVGEGVLDIEIGDLAIIDYLVDTDEEIIIDYIDDDKVVSILAVTSYHLEDSEGGDGKRKFNHAGEYKELSQVYGVFRNEQLLPIEPYVFLEAESNVINRFTPTGLSYEEEILIIERKVLAAYNSSFAKAGETVIVKDIDVFNRSFDGKEISIMLNNDVKLKKQ